RVTKHVDPIIKERLRCAGEDWSLGVPLVEAVGQKQESSTRQLTLRVLTINFASIHTFTQALYNLAAYSQYAPLREEVDALIRGNGWKKEAMMRKVDSFLAEAQRLEGVLTSSAQRKAVKDPTLSDGTFAPKGTHVCIPTYVFHRNEAVYDNPGVFNSFRFSQLSDDEGASARHLMVGVTQDYFPFEFGKHTCAGRFLAANELKTMLAYILMSYDVRFEGGVSRPSIIHWDLNVIADPTARVMFRKRTCS
ncbi:cytochrome P450, partial [Pisolithus albus]